MSVVDASVVVALLKDDEEGHQASRSWIEHGLITGEVISSPAIVLAEVAAALSRGLREKEMAERAVSYLENSPLIEILPVTLSLGRRAAEIAAAERIRGCDAVYVALAERDAVELISLDRQQLERGSGVVATRKP